MIHIVYYTSQQFYQIHWNPLQIYKPLIISRDNLNIAFLISVEDVIYKSFTSGISSSDELFNYTIF